MTPSAPSTLLKSRIRWILGLALLGILLVWVERTVGWRELLQPWTALPLSALAGAVAAVFLSHVLRAVRILDYFHLGGPEGPPRAFGRVLRLALVHNLLNTLLPMRTGEASFPLLLHRRFGVDPARSVSGLVLFRLLDLQVVLLLGCAAALRVTEFPTWIPLVLALALLALPLAIPPLRRWAGKQIAGGDGDRTPERHGIRGWLTRAVLSLPEHPRHLARTWVWTALNWGVKLAAYGFILATLGGYSWPAGVLGSITGELSSVLPIHGVAGAGTYEAGVALGLVPQGIEAESALRGAVNLHLFVLGTSIAFGTAAWLWKEYPSPGRG